MPLIPLHDTAPRFTIAYPWMTWALIAATALAFLIQVALGAEGFTRLVYGLGMIPAVLTGQAELAPKLVMADPLVTLISYQFLHGGFMHLAGNMLFLWVFGDNVEDAMGHARFLLFYLLCGVLAALAQVAADPAGSAPLIGASGAISGVLGAYLILHPRSRVLVPIFFIPLYVPAWMLLIFWFSLQALSAFSGAVQNVGWWAHVGGFLSGAVLIFLFRYRAVPLFGLGDPPTGVRLRPDGHWRRPPPRGTHPRQWRPEDRPPPEDRRKGPWG